MGRANRNSRMILVCTALLAVTASPSFGQSSGGVFAITSHIVAGGGCGPDGSGGCTPSIGSGNLVVTGTAGEPGAVEMFTQSPYSLGGGFWYATLVTPPVIIKLFGAASIPLNGSQSLSFTIQNNNITNTLTGIGFSDTLPAGVVISTPNGQTGACGGGIITATQGTNVISLSGATLAQSSSCTFAVNVTGTSAGTQNNTTGNVTSTEGGLGNTSNASLIVVTPTAISKSFGAANMPLNGSKSLSFTLFNPNATTTLTGIGFSDTLPAGLIISAPNGLAGACGGGTITATAGTNVISLSGASLASNTPCTFSVNVTGTAAGIQNNTTGNETSTEGGTGGTASASITVCGTPLITCPGSITRFTDSGQLTATVNPGAPAATDNCALQSVTGVRSDGKALNAPYPIGVTLITWTARDVSGNTASCAQSIAVMVPSGQRRKP